ncbi:MAG: UDP-N-acetylmuramoyl-L-alanyl-D-glutamate--2,6-diaminopimelate ligase [Oceanicoccus sp.]
MMAINKHKDSVLLGDLINVAGQRCAMIELSGIESDSRKIVAGNVFLAIVGHALDGRDYIARAVANGAVAILVEQGGAWTANSEWQGVPVIAVDNLTARISEIAGRFYGHPSRELSLVGVTGTNGKTSCTQLYMQLVNLLGMSCGLIGTLGAGVDGRLDEGLNTTPDAISVQRVLAEWRDSQLSIAAMEVSSHGLEQGRVADVQFDLALFTNLSRDHLDYHGSMMAYGEAKSRLFQQPGLKRAVINIDDHFGCTLVDVVPDTVSVIRYGIEKDALTHHSANVWVESVEFHQSGVVAQLHSPWGIVEINSPLLGAFNLSNLVAVICCLGLQGFSLSSVAGVIPRLVTVPGRMERIVSTADITVVIDYAHTPDGLEKALLAMRQHTRGNLWCVFGCGGNRDHGKRPLMGELVQRYADHVVVTSDNPRNEPASEIIDEILGGVEMPAMVEEDRATAIQFAIANASAGDCVLIAGKGHEVYQVIGDRRIPFSDIKQARLALANRVNAVGGISR